MNVGPQMIPSIRQGFQSTGSVSAQIEMGRRVSGIDLESLNKPQPSQDYAAQKTSRGTDPDAIFASVKGGGSSAGAGSARTGEGRTAEMLSQGIDPAIVFAADKEIEARQAEVEYGAYRKAQIREMAMLTHNRAQEGYAEASGAFEKSLMEAQDKAVRVNLMA